MFRAVLIRISQEKGSMEACFMERVARSCVLLLHLEIWRFVKAAQARDKRSASGRKMGNAGLWPAGCWKEGAVCTVRFWVISRVPGSSLAAPQNFDWKTTDFFGGMSTYTDDTVLTVAPKYAVLTNTPYAKAYSLFGKKYDRVGYGTMFKNWLNASSQKGYNSYGNGSAMRVSYIGWHYTTLEEVEEQAVLSSIVTHNHPEGVRAAMATAGCVFLARTGSSKKDISQ